MKNFAKNQLKAIHSSPLQIFIIISILLITPLYTNSQVAPKETPWKGRLGSGVEITQDDLDKILEGHKRWLLGAEKGEKKADFTSADLTGVKMMGADLSKANLYGCNFSNADLSGTVLVGAHMRGTKFINSKLIKANLTDADIRGIDYNSFTIIKDTDLSGANLTRADFSTPQNGWPGAQLTNVDLRSSIITKGTKVHGAIFTEVDLRGTDLREADFHHLDLRRSKLRDAILNGAKFIDCDLSGLDLTGFNFSNTKLSGSKLIGTIFKDSILKDTDLTGSDLEGTDFDGSDLSKAILDDTKLQKTKNLKKAKLKGASLKKADLTGMDLRDFMFIDVIFDQAHLTNAKLNNANLSGSSLVETDLSSANLEKAILTGANLELAFLKNATLIGTDLSYSILKDTDLEGGYAINANFNHSKFEPKKIEGLSFLGAKGLSNLEFEKHKMIVDLRKMARDSGFRLEDRALTAALFKYKLKYSTWSDLFFEKHVLLGWLTDYGTSPWRIVLPFIALILIFSVVYWFSLKGIAKAGIWRVWSPDRIMKNEGNYKPELLIYHGSCFRAWSWALYFSALSAFRIGWRDINIGNWLVRLQLSEYTLKATHWFRVFSGVQSLISLYLLAVGLYTYFSKPFG